MNNEEIIRELTETDARSRSNTKRLDKDGKSAAEPEETDPSKEIISDEKCPNCGSDMVLRKGAYGTFFACRNYPDCKTTKPYHKDTGFKCPLCGKKLVTKTSKSRRTFYSCEDYPNCSFSCWDIPTDETCPKCGAMVLKKKYKNIRYCSKNCGWTSEGEKKSESYYNHRWHGRRQKYAVRLTDLKQTSSMHPRRF